MRNLFSSKYMYLTAAILTGAAMFTSCSNEDDMGNVNPTYDGESVKTQFAINIPAAKLADTKMTGDNTQQATGAFLGMQNLKLIPLTATAADGMALTQTISLGTIAKTDGLDDQRKIYSDVNIPVGTKNFLFYGEALGTTEAATTTDAFAQGVLKNTITESASTNDINFELLPVTTNTQYNTEATTKKNEILTAVNNVAGAKVDETNTWKKYATDNSTKILAKLYQQFTDFPAGSAASVKLALKDLQSSIASLLGSSDETEKKMAEAINTAIEAAIGTDGNGGTLASNTYPTDYNLPVGAAQLTWADGVASYIEDASLGEEGETSTVVSLNVDKICYPAALSYFVSTNLKATDNNNPDWPSFSNWDEGTWGTEWTATEVTATTQAVALTDPIEYGIALMETAVKCKTQTLKDNAKAEGGETNDRIIIVPDDGFPVTGLLIGAQPDALKWNFKPTSDGDRNMTIYDNDVNIVAKYNDASSKNYTLVLENTKTTGNDKVNVAIEMTNNSGGDFYGKDGIIKADATFYLVGQLDINNLGTGNNDSGRTSVFEQDYKTVATFTISSLKNAYNCIPDLRATQLSLGLAVDLEWKTGIIFDVTIE